MKYYTTSQYTGNTKKKTLFRTLAILALAAGILIGTAVLGNLLKERLENASGLLALSAEDYAVRPETAGVPDYTAAPMRRPAAAQAVCGGFDPTMYQTEQELKAAAATAASLWDGISVTVRESGASLSDTAKAAEAADLFLSATVCTSHSAKTDGEILRSLADYGIRDVILYGFSAPLLTEEDAVTLLVYLEHLRGQAPDTAIGIALSPALFSDAGSAESVDRLAAYFDYLALDTTDRPEEYESAVSYAGALADSLYGSLSYYGLAVLTEGGDELNALLSLWTDAGVSRIRTLQ